MNKERLLKLADFVETYGKEEHFNMTIFFSYTVTNPKDLQNKCGTTACLAGWGCLIPEFVEAGYHAQVYDIHNPSYGIVPVFNNKIMFDALEDFFELDSNEAYYLFGEYSDQDDTVSREGETIKQATARIRQFVSDGKIHWESSDYSDVTMEDEQ